MFSNLGFIWLWSELLKDNIFFVLSKVTDCLIIIPVWTLFGSNKNALRQPNKNGHKQMKLVLRQRLYFYNLVLFFSWHFLFISAI